MTSGKAKMRLWWLAALCAGSLALSGCSHAPQDSSANTQTADNDPWEPVNRGIYKFNYAFDGVVLRPVTSVYRGVVPEQGRNMVSHFLDNLYSPVVFANSVLQTDPQNSFATFWRFMINTTFGIGGLFDAASEVGLKNRPADFGETLAFYGVGDGPYVMLPVLGPSNARDAVGRLGDYFMNPVSYMNNTVTYSVWGATAIDTRSRNMKLLDDVYSTSLDPYATFRSGYTQKRAATIKKGKEDRKKALEKAGFCVNE